MPVAVVTAHPTVDRAVTAMRHAGTDFIHKPVTAEEFAAKVSSLVAQRKPAAAAAKESVLAIGAHPGDVEIGAAGALLAHKAAGVPVTILTLSAAQPGAAAGEAGHAAPQAAGGLGTRLALGDLVAPGSAEANPVGAAIDRVLADVQPTVLYIHSEHDDQPDHRSAHQAAIAGARRIGQVYCFQSPSATIDFRPTRFVPIEDLGGKLQVVGAFSGRDEVRAFLVPDQVTSTAMYWGRYCQAQHAEAFEVVRDG
jgi:LmbE family N-acetylglucosaminyl deacetylase